MARPKNADGQRTRQAILDAALDLFAEKGYFGTSLREVAATVGVRESALYHYFPGKESLFEALIAADQHTKIERMSAALGEPGGDPRALLERLALARLKGFMEPRQQQLFRILMSDGVRMARAGRLNLVERMSTGQAWLQDVMRQLTRLDQLRDADPEMLALSFAAPLAIWRQLHAIKADAPIVRNPRAFARKHVEQFLRGAGRPPAARRAPAAKRRVPRASRAASRASQ